MKTSPQTGQASEPDHYNTPLKRGDPRQKLKSEAELIALNSEDLQYKTCQRWSNAEQKSREPRTRLRPQLPLSRGLDHGQRIADFLVSAFR
jgi:hypothetical protein